MSQGWWAWVVALVTESSKYHRGCFFLPVYSFWLFMNLDKAHGAKYKYSYLTILGLREFFTNFAVLKSLWKPHFLCVCIHASCQQKEKRKVSGCDSGNLSPPINVFSPPIPRYEPYTPSQKYTHSGWQIGKSFLKKKKVKQSSKVILCCWGNW